MDACSSKGGHAAAMSFVSFVIIYSYYGWCILICIKASLGYLTQGRRMELISLQKPLSGGLGFSVVGLRPEGVGGHGVFVRQVQPGSVADRWDLSALFKHHIFFKYLLCCFRSFSFWLFLFVIATSLFWCWILLEQLVVKSLDILDLIYSSLSFLKSAWFFFNY